MTRRACCLVVQAVLTACLLPACSSTVGHLVTCDGLKTDTSTAQLPPQVRTGQYLGSEEAEPVIAQPRRPEGQLAKDAQPPGQRVPEFTGPPQVLPPPQTTLPQIPQVASKIGLDLPSPRPASAETDDPLVCAMRCLVNKQPADALKHLERCDSANQELLMRLLPTVTLLKEKAVSKMTPAELAALQDQLHEMLASVRSRSDLAIEKMHLCERIIGYGQFTPLPDGHAFHPGQGRQAGDMVQVYIELRNLNCELRDRYYVTSLVSTVSIRDSQGTPVWTYNYRKRETPLRSLLPRYDCYRAYDFFVPAMPPGKYTLTLEVTDETRQPHRVAQKSVEFIVAGQNP